MFDPVTTQNRTILFLKKRREKMIEGATPSKPSKCSHCGKENKDLYNGRCIICQTQIAEAIFHHQIPQSDLKTLGKGKKKI
jgi:hypothetical protein